MHYCSEFNLETLTEKEIAAMDIILKASGFVRKHMVQY